MKSTLHKLLLILFCFLFVFANAQDANNYAFTSATNGSLTDMSTGTTQLVGPGNDAVQSSVTPLPFPFVFMGIVYTHFAAGSDGAFKLGDVSMNTAGISTTNDLTPTTVYPVIAPFWDDLATTTTTGKVHFTVTGTAPNRALVIEWLNMEINYSSSTANGTYQARIYENTGVIEFVYGPMAVGAGSGTVSASIGFSNGNTSNTFSSITSLTTPAVTTTLGSESNLLVNSSTAGAITGLNSTTNGSRVVFNWTPTTPSAAPTALTFSNTGLTSMQLNWNDNSANELGFAIFRSTDGVNYTYVGSTAAGATSYIATGLTAGTPYQWRVSAFTEGALSAPATGSQTTTAPAPMSGIYTINNTQPTAGSNFNNFTDAFNAINGNGLSGAVTFHVFANQTFTEVLMPLIASGTATNPITFKRINSGSNPVVQRSDAGTIATSTMGGQGDAVIIIQGGDYITFDSIDVASYDQGIEYGYLLRKASATDGCKNVSINHANITMARGTSTYVTGIYSSNLDAASAPGVSTGITITSTGGRSENITITGNFISNVFHGIQLRGFAASTPYDFYDQNFVIGAAGTNNANTISNFGGTSTTVAYGVYIIYHNNAAVNYNNVNNTDAGGVASTSTMYGIYMTTGTNAAFTANYNNVNLTNGYASGSLYGIYNGGASGNLTINNNQVALSNGSSSSGTFGFIYNVGTGSAATALSVSNNVISTSGITSTGTIYLIYNSASYAAVATIQNNSNTSPFNVSGTAATYCYYNLSSPTGIDNFSGNQFFDMTLGGSFYGNYTSTSATHRRNIYSNTFMNITTAGGTMYGIYKAAGGSNIYNNKIAGFTSNVAGSSSVYGIYVSTGTKDSIYNNIVGDLTAPSSTSTNGVVGIYDGSSSATSTVGVYFNTVYLSAISSGANFGSSAMYAIGSATATSGSLEMKNNIFVNNSVPNGTGYTSVYRRSSTSLANYASTSNNNLFYTASAGGNTVYFYDGTNNDVAFNDFKARVTPRETSSVSENPPFVSIVPSDASYLHIGTGTPTQIESGGTPVSGISVDFDGNARNASTPDIGADEFAGIATDLTGPTIAYTPFTNTICYENRTITATITDASGVNTTAGTKPRLWYKKSTENNALPATNTSASNGWKWVEASNSSSPFTFTLNYSLLASPIAAGDSISYFIVAQDLASTPNVGANTAVFNSTPPTVALSAGSFPATGNIKGFKMLSQTAPMVIQVSRTNLCESGAVTLDVNGSDVTGGSYQWQSSPTGANTWTNLASGTTIPYTTPVFNTSTDFRLVVSCNGTPIASSPSNLVTVTVNNPQLTSTTPGSRCGVGTVNLAATGSAGTDVKWYANASGGLPIYTGNNFTTPVINNTTTFYAAASKAGVTQETTAVGAGATTSSTYSNPFYSLWSNTHNQHVILASELLAAGITAGEMTAIGLNVTSAGTLPMLDLSVKLGSTTTNDATAFISAAFTTVYTSPSYMPVTGLNMLSFSTPFLWDGTSNLVIEICHGNPSSTATMSRTVLADNTSFVSTIHTHKTSGTDGSTQCGDVATNKTTYSVRPQFTIAFTGACVGSRTAVIATVNAAPALTGVTATPSTICDGQSSTLSVSSSNAGYTYTWTPGGAGSSITVSPTTTTKYYVSANDNSGGTYNGCANKDSVTVTVNVSPSTMTITPAATICSSTDPAKMLTVTGGTLSNVSILAENFNGPSNTWTTSNSTTGATPSEAAWTLRPDGYSYGSTPTVFHSNDNSQFYLSNSDAVGSGANTLTSLTTPAFSTAGFTSVQLQFYQFFKARLSSSGQVQVSTDNSAWTTITTYTSTDVGTEGGFVIASINLDAYAGMPNVYVRFLYTAGWDWYWAIDNVSITGTKTTTITWSPSTGLYTNAAATTPYSGGNATTVYAKPTSTTTYTATATAQNACTRTATVTITHNCAVPITLLQFKGERSGLINKLEWTTATEINNAAFELQRSADGINFSSLVVVASKALNGNSVSTLTYSFDDVRPLVGNGYYRLKQIDKDGKSTMSKVVLIKGAKVNAVTFTSIYPNPVQDKLNTIIASPTSEVVHLVITDLSGKVISKQAASLVSGDNKVELPVSNLASGTYFIKATCANGCETAVHKFVKQ